MKIDQVANKKFIRFHFSRHIDSKPKYFFPRPETELLSETKSETNKRTKIKNKKKLKLKFVKESKSNAGESKESINFSLKTFITSSSNSHPLLLSRLNS